MTQHSFRNYRKQITASEHCHNSVAKEIPETQLHATLNRTCNYAKRKEEVGARYREVTRKHSTAQEFNFLLSRNVHDFCQVVNSTTLYVGGSGRRLTMLQTNRPSHRNSTTVSGVPNPNT